VGGRASESCALVRHAGDAAVEVGWPVSESTRPRSGLVCCATQPLDMVFMPLRYCLHADSCRHARCTSGFEEIAEIPLGLIQVLDLRFWGSRGGEMSGMFGHNLVVRKNTSRLTTGGRIRIGEPPVFSLWDPLWAWSGIGHELVSSYTTETTIGCLATAGSLEIGSLRWQGTHGLSRSFQISWIVNCMYVSTIL